MIRVSRMAIGMGMPYQAMKVTLRAAAIVAVEPMDRSITPVEKAKVAPRAMTVVMEIERRMVTMLAQEKNAWGAVTEKITNAITMATMAPQFTRKRPI